MREEITIPQIISLHSHLRQLPILEQLVRLNDPYYVIMCKPNFSDPVDRFRPWRAHRNLLYSLNPKFIPMLSSMFTDRTTLEDLKKLARSGCRVMTFIPKSASNNSDVGLTFYELLERKMEHLRLMRDLGMVFSIHTELPADANGNTIPFALREGKALVLIKVIIEEVPGLIIVLEHLTTAGGVEFVRMAPPNVHATITAHHMKLRREDFEDETGKIRNPYNFCMPVLKGFEDNEALIEAALSGSEKFGFGPDDAYHPLESKTGEVIKPGIFAPPQIAAPAVAEIFQIRGGTDENLAKFMSQNGLLWYRIKPSQQTTTFTRIPHRVPAEICGAVPFLAGETVEYQLAA